MSKLKEVSHNALLFMNISFKVDHFYGKNTSFILIKKQIKVIKTINLNKS